jgi:glycosyltransferase involved in cell wall biosynthesis
VKDSRVKTIRVLFVGPYPPPDDGTSIPFRTLVQFAESTREIEVGLLSTQSGDKEGKSLLSLGVVLPFLKITTKLLRLGRKYDYVVINGSQRYVATAGAVHAAILGYFLHRKVGIYVAGGSFDLYLQSIPKVARASVQVCFARVTSMIVQTHQSASGLKGVLKRVGVVPNWVDTAAIKSRADLEHFSATIPGARRHLQVAFVGEVIPEKGVVDLILAIRRLVDEPGEGTGKIVLNIYGRLHPVSSPGLTNLFDENKHFVRYHGSLSHDNLLKRLPENDILALPTRWSSEGYPGVILEAMACGVPVVASRFRAIPEIIVDGETGLLCEPGDVDSLVACLRRLIAHEELRDRLANNALNFVQEFDYRIVLRRLLDTLQLPGGKGEDQLNTASTRAFVQTNSRV